VLLNPYKIFKNVYVMKKFVLIAMMGLMSLASFAQVTVGVSALRETGNNGYYGAGIQVGYQIGAVNIVPSYNYFFAQPGVVGYDTVDEQSVPRNGDLSHQSFNLDLQYLVKIANTNLTVYPLVGFNFTNYFEDGNYPKSNKGEKYDANLGAGLRYSIANGISALLETKHGILADDSNTKIVSLGLIYQF
jgi:hypothetical protein